MIINHNINATISNNRADMEEKTKANTMKKISSGLRINQASDDAAGCAISQKMKAQIRGIEQADRNLQDGISLVQTAEAGLGSIQNPNLLRMRDLTLQALNGTLSQEDRAKIQNELDSIKASIDDIANDTDFNGIKLLCVGENSEVLPTTEKIVTVNPGEKIIAGYIEVPSPADPGTLEVEALFGTISGAVWPDLNIESPNGEWFGYNTPNMNGSSYQESTTNSSSQKATYSGWGSSNEKMTFENPIPGKWFVEISHDGGSSPSTFTLKSNYLINDTNSTNQGINTGINQDKLEFQVGANSEELFQVDLFDARTTNLGIDALLVDPIEEAEKSLGQIDNAIDIVMNQRGKFGAYQNALEHIGNNALNYSYNITSAESRISDADMAKEVMKMSKSSIIQQSAQAMENQAENMSQSILDLMSKWKTQG